MKIGVNGRFLSRPFTGIGQYTINLYRAMSAAHPQDEFIFFTESACEVELPANCRILVIPEWKIGTGGMRKTFWEQYLIQRAMLREDVDVAHFPYPANPWRKFAIPCVVTVHDTIPWSVGDYQRSLSTRIYQSAVKNGVKKADHVLTVSEESKREIIDMTGYNSTKISVVYNAVSEMFEHRVADDRAKEILKKHGIDMRKPYLLYVGGFDERKNVRMLCDVFVNEIAPRFEIDLVLVGGKSVNDRLYASLDHLTKAKKRLRFKSHKGNMIVTGFIAEAELPALYQSSFAFINLSKKEGFDLPLLEAASSKVPIITSDIAVHHEVAGDLPLYVDHDNPGAVSEVIEKLFEDKAFYQKQKHKAQKFRCPYSWKKSAEQTYCIIKSLV